MNVRCPTCQRWLDVRQSWTGREFFFCANIHCPDYGPQDWLPEPLHEETSRAALYCVAVLLAGALAWLGLDRFEEKWRDHGNQHTEVHQAWSR